jgi:hypothetical protein
VEKCGHFLNEFPSNTRVATNQRIEADEDRSTNPRFWHAGRSKRIEKRKGREDIRGRR